ncbi:MAG TPA: hypothetical protein PKK50_03955 [Myxococcota bacterium]|nr:hypothetical protein [Myxococcota bacterium]
MKKLMHLGMAAVLAFAVACGDGETTNDQGGLADVADGVEDVIEDTATPDTEPLDRIEPDGNTTDTVSDVPGDTAEEIQMVDKHFTFRTVGGMSMGAAALTVAAHYPDMFDSVGGMGGYVDYRYIGHLLKDQMGGGFCPMEDILEVIAQDELNGTNEINNRENPKVDCYLPVEQRKLRPYEIYMTYNRMNYSKQAGTTFHRGFYIDVIGAIVYAFGNFFFYNPEHPLVPQGVDPAWLLQTDSEKCANPMHVQFPYNLNAEYNPTGEYDLISFCDGSPDVCRGIPDCDDEAPEMRAMRGWFWPDQPDRLTMPVTGFMAVDYNGNGKRDLGEPVVFNLGERWDDVGVDGCPNEFEDGNGGCNETASGSADVDANGDDWDLMTNNQGTENNSEYDDGEPYEDFGLDGVDSNSIPLAAMGTVDRSISIVDYGEGDGEYTYNPRWQAMIENDARAYFRKAPLEDLQKANYFFDGGIRDGLGALTSALHLANALKDRGIDVRTYQNFTGFEDSVFPGLTCNQMLGTKEDFGTVDFSRKSFGPSFLIAYGDPTMEEEKAYKDGSGNHIGNGCEVSLRGLVPYAAANFRIPDPVVVPNNNFLGEIFYSSYYSDVLQSRRWFSVNLPPDYDSTECYANCDAANPDDKVLFNELEYPVSYMLPGIGMPLDGMSILTMLFNLTMGYGSGPRYILIVPDGQCCFRNKTTGAQVCNCFENGDNMTCVDNECKGPHETCTVTDIPKSEFNPNHEQECNSGHFFVNQATNRYGANGADLETLKFEDAFIEQVLATENMFRIRKPATVKVPADF